MVSILNTPVPMPPGSGMTITVHCVCIRNTGLNHKTHEVSFGSDNYEPGMTYVEEFRIVTSSNHTFRVGQGYELSFYNRQ